MITTDDKDRTHTQWRVARCRSSAETGHDFIAVPEFKAQEPQSWAKCNLMVSERNTTLTAISRGIMNMSPQAFGKQSANNVILSISTTVQQEPIARQPMLVVRLAVTSDLPDYTFDATLECHLSIFLDLEYIIRQEHDHLASEAQQIGMQTLEKVAKLAGLRGRLMEH